MSCPESERFELGRLPVCIIFRVIAIRVPATRRLFRLVINFSFLAGLVYDLLMQSWLSLPCRVYFVSITLYTQFSDLCEE